MKKFIKTVALIALITIGSTLMAQNPPHPNGGGDPTTGGNTPVGGGAPIGGGHKVFYFIKTFCVAMPSSLSTFTT